MTNYNVISKICNFAYSTVKRIKPAKMVEAESGTLFSFAERHPVKMASSGIYDIDGFVLTHLTDYTPKNGYIDTVKTAISGIRDSVHFAVNHGVTPHELGSWNTKKLAILMPLKGAMKIPENHFAGGVAGDFFSKGRVKIPKGSVIVRYNEKIPKGKYKIRNAAVVKELRDLRGVELIETSEKNMKVNVDNIITKMGYDLKDTDYAFFWGKKSSRGKYKDFGRFNNFLQKHNMQPMLHSHTPNGKLDILIETLLLRSKTNLEWTTQLKNGKTINAKEDIIKALDYIEEYAQKTGYPLDFDTKALRTIINESQTPKEAAQILKEKLGIKTLLNEEPQIESFCKATVNEQEQGLKSTTDLFCGEALAETDKAVNHYISNPNEKTLRTLNKVAERTQRPVYEKIIDIFE